MTSEDPSTASTTGGTRRPRQGLGGSPVGSTISIVLAVIAVVAGFLILRNITDDSNPNNDGTPIQQPSGGSTTTSTLFDVNDTTTTSTTTIPRVVDGATVVVANGNSVGGSAGRMTRTLETAGYTLGEPVNADSSGDDTTVYYDATVTAAQAVASSVGVDMGCVEVLPMPTPPPTESGSLDDADVLVVLGNNRADKTLAEMAEEGCAALTPANTAPAVSGSSTTVAGATTTTTG